MLMLVNRSWVMLRLIGHYTFLVLSEVELHLSNTTLSNCSGGWPTKSSYRPAHLWQGVWTVKWWQNSENEKVSSVATRGTEEDGRSKRKPSGCCSNHGTSQASTILLAFVFDLRPTVQRSFVWLRERSAGPGASFQSGEAGMLIGFALLWLWYKFFRGISFFVVHYSQHITVFKWERKLGVLFFILSFDEPNQFHGSLCCKFVNRRRRSYQSE